MIPDNPIRLIFVGVAAAVFLRLLLKTSLLYLLKQWWLSIDEKFHAHLSFKIPQFNELGQENQLYRKVSTYLNSLSSLEDSHLTNLFSKSNEIVLSLDPNQTITDSFLSARLRWTSEADPQNDAARAAFVLRLRRSDKRRILRPYLQHIHAVSEEIEQRRRELRLHIDSRDAAAAAGKPNGRWRSVPFTHPATIETVVLDQDLKNRIKSDLELFLKSKNYYHRLGRVWKRSYLLYGSPGTGKSSFVAAMARLLCYDVYDVDLSRVSDGQDLKALLLQTAPKSLILVEDLDRFLEKGGSTAGLLGFMDGIFSCVGEERVMVFTMSGKDRVDPAVLRPGRVDVHVHFPPCDFSAFKSLAVSHLGLKDHKLFPQVEESFQAGPATLSPAEVGEIMISNRSSPSRAIKTVISALQSQANNAGSGPGGKISTRLAGAGAGAGAGVVQSSEDEPEATVVCKESIHMVREFRKLYGLLRMRSGRKEDIFESGPIEKDGSRRGG